MPRRIRITARATPIPMPAFAPVERPLPEFCVSAFGCVAVACAAASVAVVDASLLVVEDDVDDAEVLLELEVLALGSKATCSPFKI